MAVAAAARRRVAPPDEPSVPEALKKFIPNVHMLSILLAIHCVLQTKTNTFF